MSPDESNECHMSINECQFGPYDLPSVPDDESSLVPNGCQIVWMTTKWVHSALISRDQCQIDPYLSVLMRAKLIDAGEP